MAADLSEPAGERRGLPHIPALDGLRGLAVAAVLAFHAGALRGGYLGVDLFFVLSGFLITSLLLAEQRATGRIRLARFWARRARRLLPALLLVLLGVAGYAGLLAAPEELGRIRADALASLAYVANWWTLLAGNDYWALFRAPSPLVHMWSLAIEEQFYALWPLVVALALRLARGSSRALAAVCLVLALASLAWMIALRRAGADVARVYLGTDTRAAALLLGAALAASEPERWTAARPGLRRALEGVACAAAAGLAWAWARVDGQREALYGQGGLFLCGLATVAILAAAGRAEPGPLARALSLAPLRALGRISYGLYLWHWPVFVALTEARTGLDGAPLAACRLALSFGLAIASYHLVELPVRRGSFPGWRMLAVAPAAVVAVVGAVLASTAGAVTPPLEGSPADADALLPPPHAGAAGASPQRILVVGDSVGYYLGEELERLPVEAGVLVHNRAVIGCGLVRGSQRIRLPDGTISVRGRCGDWEARWRDDVARFRPDLVLLALAGPTRGDLDIDGQWLHPCQPAFDDQYRRAAATAIDVLGGDGAVVVIATTPYVDRNEGYAQNRERTDCVNGAYEAAVAESPFAETVDLARFVCPSRECRTRVGGAVLRPDGTHFQGEGARIAVRWLLGAIRDLPLAELRAAAPRRRP
ncbi:acyltransferase family protein [Sorangium sp. So ce134]